MSELLISNIGTLFQVNQRARGDMKECPTLNDAWIHIRDEKISSFGTGKAPVVSNVIDAAGEFVFPAFCDSHSHIIYAGSREGEFSDRLKGFTYQQIAERGGGILNSASRLRKASEEELIDGALGRINEVIACGTGALEIKSGYGLSLDSELKMLRVIKKLKTLTPVTIRSTFLGAHAVPAEYKSSKEKYISVIIEEMLPAIAEENLADFCDVFCEENYFSQEETVRILEAALKYNIQPKVHANQMSFSGGVQAGVKVRAVSVDHLEYVGEEEIKLLSSSATIATLLPGAQFFLQLPPPPARQMIDAGICVALASDYNPGSSPTGNMQLMMALACIQYKMSPEEALNAATVNGASAMLADDEVGSIASGKKANLIITRPMPSLAYWPYSFGSNLVDTVILNGSVIS